MIHMRKADIYKKGMQDALGPFSEKLNYVADTVNDTREIVDDIIDCIEWNVDNPEELVNNLKAKRKKPKQFRISIVYRGKENEPLADALRKDLNNQNNTCEKVEYTTFTKHIGSLVDYRVYIGNPEKTKAENCQVLYKAYGMTILQWDSSYIVEYDPKHSFTEENKDKFISYYESVISKSLEKSKAAEKALKSRKKRKLLNPTGSEPKGTYAAMDALTNSIDFWDDKPSWMTLLLGLPSMLFSLVTMVLLIPVGIGELTLRETVENLREANFDNKFVADAQRQILEVKLVDLFKHEQIRDIYDSDHTEPARSTQAAPPNAFINPKSDEGENTSSQKKVNDLVHATTSTNDGGKKESYAGTSGLFYSTPTSNCNTSEMEISGVINELIRYGASDSLRIQIQGKVISGNITIGAYCKLYGQEDVYQVMSMGFDVNGNMTECGPGGFTKFTLKKV